MIMSCTALTTTNNTCAKKRKYGKTINSLMGFQVRIPSLGGPMTSEHRHSPWTIRRNTSTAPVNNKVVVTRRRRRPEPTSSSTCLSPFKCRALIVITACVLLYSSHFIQTEAFGRSLKSGMMIRLLHTRQNGRSSSVAFSLPPLHASKIDQNTEKDKAESWSKAPSSTKRSGSPLQVRKRVRAVLEKARTRTGVSISSRINPGQIDNRRAPSVVAEAASIGGLGVDGPADLVMDASANALNRVNDQNGMKDQNQTSLGTAPTTTRLNISDEELWLEKNDNTVQKSNGVSSPTEAVAGVSNLPDEASIGEGAAASQRSASATLQRKPKDFDVIRGDVPAANRFVEPLPFDLPKLSAEQKQLLVRGERVQEQSRMGREGSGFVVLDVKAPPFVVWECLLDFEKYPDMIPTVKQMQLYTSKKLNTGYVNEKPVVPGTGRETRHYGIPSITRASFVLSKFRLNIAAIHSYTPHPDGDYMEFTLDKSCTNMVLKGAKGIWYTEENPEGREGYTRVYLLASLQISRALPTFIVDYAADRAMPRATTWLKPEVEGLAKSWLDN